MWEVLELEALQWTSIAKGHSISFVFYSFDKRVMIPFYHQMYQMMSTVHNARGVVGVGGGSMIVWSMDASQCERKYTSRCHSELNVRNLDCEEIRFWTQDGDREGFQNWSDRTDSDSASLGGCETRRQKFWFQFLEKKLLLRVQSLLLLLPQARC